MSQYRTSEVASSVLDIVKSRQEYREMLFPRELLTGSFEGYEVTILIARSTSIWKIRLNVASVPFSLHLSSLPYAHKIDSPSTVFEDKTFTNAYYVDTSSDQFARTLITQQIQSKIVNHEVFSLLITPGSIQLAFKREEADHETVRSYLALLVSLNRKLQTTAREQEEALLVEAKKLHAYREEPDSTAVALAVAKRDKAVAEMNSRVLVRNLRLKRIEQAFIVIGLCTLASCGAGIATRTDWLLYSPLLALLTAQILRALGLSHRSEVLPLEVPDV